MTATLAGAVRVTVTEREARQAKDVLGTLGRPDGSLSVDLDGQRVGPLPRDVGIVLQSVLQAMADGRTVTIGTIPEIVTTSTAASMLGISRPTLMKMIKDGEIQAHKVGSHHRLRAEDVLAARKARRARERAAFDQLRELDDSTD